MFRVWFIIIIIPTQQYKKNINMSQETTTPQQIPKRVFVVPYRNRLQQKFFFSHHMSFLLEKEDDYEIYFSHQCDSRQFNRGATKNIGFLAVKEKYPDHYKDITFIFNDVDTLPFHRIFSYQTNPGVVSHYYGFEYALGGIVVIKGGDFEQMNGFPNFWGWGNEDSVFQIRCMKAGLHIDRSRFFKIGSPEILQLFDGVERLITPREHKAGKEDKGDNGLTTIHRVTYSLDKESNNPLDNQYIVENPRFEYINIYTFLTETRFERNDYYEYDLRDSTRTIVRPQKPKTDRRDISTDDWKRIPERKQIPSSGLQQRNLTPTQKYSTQYARQIGVKPRAATSAVLPTLPIKHQSTNRF